jgi:hypothetical protein
VIPLTPEIAVLYPILAVEKRGSSARAGAETSLLGPQPSLGMEMRGDTLAEQEHGAHDAAVRPTGRAMRQTRELIPNGSR